MADQAKLASDILSAARRGLPTMFLRRGGELPDLRAQARRIRPLDEAEAPTAAAMAVLRAAVDKLPDDKTPEKSTLPWRRFGLIMLGLEDAKEEVPNYSQRRSSCIAYWDHERSLQDDLPRLYERLAEELIEMPAKQSLPPSEPELWDGEIRRRDEELNLRIALADTTRPVNVWGESGNGKSYLVRQYLKNNYSDRTSIIRAADTDNPVYRLDLVSTLRKCGHAPESWTVAAMEATLRDELECGTALDVVLLDDVDEQTAQRLVRTIGSAAVVLTSQHKLALTQVKDIKLESYTPAEALEASQLLLPDEDEEALRTLCECLANRPVVIDIACRIVRDGRLTLGQLVSAIQDDVVQALDDVHDLHGGYVPPYGGEWPKTFRIVYQKLVDELCSRAGNPLALLDTLLWITGPATAATVIGNCLSLDPNVTSLSATGALRALERLGVIGIRDGSIEINDLTLELLRRCALDRVEPAVAAYLASLRATNTYRAAQAGPVEIAGAPDDAAAEREIAAKVLSITSGVIRDITGDDKTGCVRCGSNVLLWQEAPPRFEVVVTGNGDMIRLFGSRGVERLNLDGGADQLHDYALVLLAFMAHPVSLAGGPGRRAPAVREVKGPPRDHLQVSLVSPLAAAIAGIPLWTACGRLTQPRIDGLDDLELCEDCFSGGMADSLVSLLAFLRKVASLTGPRTDPRWSLRLANVVYGLDPASWENRKPDAAALRYWRRRSGDARQADGQLRNIVDLLLVEIYLGILARDTLFWAGRLDRRELIAKVEGFIDMERIDQLLVDPRAATKDKALTTLRAVAGLGAVLTEQLDGVHIVAANDARLGRLLRIREESDDQLVRTLTLAPGHDILTWTDDERIFVSISTHSAARREFVGEDADDIESSASDPTDARQ